MHALKILLAFVKTLASPPRLHYSTHAPQPTEERHMAASEAQRQHAAERNKKIAEFCRTNSGKEACEYFGVSLRTVRYAVAQAKRARWAHLVEE